MSDDERPKPKMQPGRRGGSLQIGNPGNKGGGNPAGRVPKEFRIRMKAILDRSRLAQRLESIIDNPKTPTKELLAAGEFVADRALGKPTQHIELPDSLPTLVIKRDDTIDPPDEAA